MTYSTSNTYQLKRKIVTFSNKISEGLSKSERKFSADMIYGMLASKSCLLTDIVDQLHEPSKKINGVDRLSKHLAKGIAGILAHAKEGVHAWFRTRHPAYYQLCFKFIA
ncbi:MAG: hypothetical protein RR790_06905 [Eubacterium sp.]